MARSSPRRVSRPAASAPPLIPVPSPLAMIENIGRALRVRVDDGVGFSADDTVLLLAHMRDLYRALRVAPGPAA